MREELHDQQEQLSDGWRENIDGWDIKRKGNVLQNESFTIRHHTEVLLSFFSLVAAFLYLSLSHLDT